MKSVSSTSQTRNDIVWEGGEIRRHGLIVDFQGKETEHQLGSQQKPQVSWQEK